MTETAYDKNGQEARVDPPATDGGEAVVADAMAIERAKKAAIDPLGGVSDDFLARWVMDRNQERILIVYPNQDVGDPYVRLSTPHGIWRRSEDDFYRWVRQAVKAIIDEDKDIPPDKMSAAAVIAKRKQMAKWLSVQGAERVRGVIPGVYSDEHVAREANGIPGRYPRISVCEAKDLDAKQRYLGTPNGIVDLHNPTHRLDPRTREAQAALVTKMTAVPFNPTLNGISPEAIADVDSILAHLPREDQEWVWDSMAWELRGAGGRVYFWLGKTATGKSTFNRGLTACLGDYGCHVSNDVFLSKGYRTNTDDATANAIGKRIGRTDEMPPVVTPAMVERMKDYSGREEKAARASYQKEGKEGLLPTLVASVNNPPDFYGDSPEFKGENFDETAIDRRLRIMEFPRRPGGVDETLADRVAMDVERQTVFLARLLTRVGDVKVPPPMSAKQVEFMYDQRDKLSGGAISWIDKHIIRDKDARVSSKAVWLRAIETHGADDKESDKLTVFGYAQRKLTGMVTKRFGIAPSRFKDPIHGAGAGWEGLRLRTDEEVAKQDGDAPAPHTPTTAPSKAEQPRPAPITPRHAPETHRGTAPVRAPEASTRQQIVQPIDTGDLRGGIRCLGECGELYAREDMSTPTLCKNCAE